MPALPLRPAEPKDIEAIVRLVNDAFLAERPYIEGERVNAETVREMLARGGLGSRLLAGAESHCRSAGYREMELRFINHRTELQRFYQKQGFAETGLTETLPDTKRIRVPFHFVQMVKRLG